MPFKSDHKDERNDKSLIDYFLYALAGGAFAAIGFSFLLWLRS